MHSCADALRCGCESYRSAHGVPFTSEGQPLLSINTARVGRSFHQKPSYSLISIRASNMSHGKQFTLFNTGIGPNGWYASNHSLVVAYTQCHSVHRKIDMILRELGLSYESVCVDLGAGEHRAPDFVKYNPNGRVPALIDHSYNDFVVWWVLPCSVPLN